MAATIIRLAMLNADIPVPAVREVYPSYGFIFHALLSNAASRLSKSARPPGVITVQSEEFDIVNGDYPSTPADFDALIVTGSSASSYDDHEWARRLDAYIKYVYERFPKVKMFGSCFGHQIICQSLLGEHGVRVEHDPKGWELGVHEIRLADKFLEALGGHNEFDIPGSPPVLRLQLIHADHVVLPGASRNALPPNWICVGRSDHCALQGMYQPGRVLTYQGHFEFDRFINTETIKVFGTNWDSDLLHKSLLAIDKDDDAEDAADMVVRFLMEGTQQNTA